MQKGGRSVWDVHQKGAAAARQNHHPHEAARHQRQPPPSCSASGSTRACPTHHILPSFHSGGSRQHVMQPLCFLHCTDIQLLQRGKEAIIYPGEAGRLQQWAKSSLSQPDTAGNGEDSSVIHDEVRDCAWTSTTTLLEGDMGIQESGCNPQPSQTSDPSYFTAKVMLNPNKPRFNSNVSLLINMTMPHKSTCFI